MKGIYVFIFTLMLGQNVFSQVHISTSKKEVFDWNVRTKEWDFNQEDDTFVSLLDLNKEWTVFKHTTEQMSSTYYVKSNEHDKEAETWTFTVVSDVGNKYLVILDMANDNVRFIGKDKNGDNFMVRYKIKRIWMDDK